MISEASRPWPERDDLLARIQSYLGNGGFFNPEMMEHDKVRDLIMDVRNRPATQSSNEADSNETHHHEQTGVV